MSKALVASSNNKIGVLTSSARAIDKRCFCPCEKRRPSSLTGVLIPSSNPSTNSHAQAVFKT